MVKDTGATLRGEGRGRAAGAPSADRPVVRMTRVSSPMSSGRPMVACPHRGHAAGPLRTTRSTTMASNARDRARSLELIIRAAAAEERLLQRRLDRVADAQPKPRADFTIESEHEHFGRLPPQAEDGSSDR